MRLGAAVVLLRGVSVAACVRRAAPTARAGAPVAAPATRPAVAPITCPPPATGSPIVSAVRDGGPTARGRATAPASTGVGSTRGHQPRRCTPVRFPRRRVAASSPSARSGGDTGLEGRRAATGAGARAAIRGGCRQGVSVSRRASPPRGRGTALSPSRGPSGAVTGGARRVHLIARPAGAGPRATEASLAVPRVFHAGGT